jgi:hypothetical protein
VAARKSGGSEDAALGGTPRKRSPKVVEQVWPEGVPLPPKGLEPGGLGEQMWVDMHCEYSFDGAPEKRLLLRELVFTVDMVERLRLIVAEAECLRTRGSQGQEVEIPEVSSLRNYRGQVIALTKALCLPEEETDGAMTRSQLARHAANARWARRNG